jgi:hypothetical protein
MQINTRAMLNVSGIVFLEKVKKMEQISVIVDKKAIFLSKYNCIVLK